MTAPVEIRDYTPADQPAFYRINVEWIERYFTLEPVDERVLLDPQTHILDEAGHIVVASLDGDVVGTAALRKEGDGHYELTKMAVLEACQGRGIGGQLLDAMIRRFFDLQGRLLSLESESSLDVAVAMYERAGFRHAPRLRPSEYDRCDVFMVYDGEDLRGGPRDRG